MRRLLSILLLAVLGLPFASPLFALSAKAQSGLPACCRRDGKHHCAMTYDDQGRPTGAVLRAPMTCCSYASQVAVNVHVNLASATPQAWVFSPMVSHPTSPAQAASMLRISRDRSRQKRGPPSLSLL